MSLKYRFEFFLFQSLLFLFGIFPKRLVVALGRGFGSFCYFLGIRRSVVETNLEIAFGDSLSEPERKQLTKRVYKNVASVFFEVLLMKHISPEQLGKYIHIEGLEALQEAIAEGKGVTVAGSHFGHWELLTAGIAQATESFGSSFQGYAGKQKNSLFDDSLNGIRQKFGMKTITKSKAATRQMLKVLRKKEVLGILGDLNVPHDSLFVEFFGKKAAYGTGLPTFTVLKKNPLFFAWVVRKGPLQHQGHIIRLNYELTGDQEKDVAHVASLVSQQLEKVIRENPDHYFWFNRRWKTRPADEPKENIYG